MNKEHLETDLTIKTFYKVGHTLELKHLQIAPLFVHLEVEYIHLHGSNRPGKQEYSQFYCPNGSSIRIMQLYDH